MENEISVLVEIYKIHANQADGISQKRSQSNKFYFSILSGLFAILAFYFDYFQNNKIGQKSDLLLLFGILGVILCIIWWFNIKSYRQLNSGKFKVLHDLEAKLPYQFYTKEWELLNSGKRLNKYFRLTRIEQLMPVLMAIPYLILIIMAY